MNFLNSLNCMGKEAVDENTDAYNSDLRVIAAMKEIYKLRNLQDDVDYQIYKVELNTLPGHILVTESGFKNSQKLLMVHGYGGCAATYFKVLPELSKHFHVFMFDMYGMGGSYRFDFVDLIKDWKDAMNVMTKSINEMIQKLDLDNFYILAHSMGGYITAHYLSMYRHRIRGVFMVSPAGFSKPSDQIVNDWLERQLDKAEYDKNWVKRSTIKATWKGAMNVIDHTKLSPWHFMIAFKDKILNSWLGQENFLFSEEERTAWVNLYLAMLKTKLSGDKFLGYFLKYCSYSDHPFGHLIPDLMDSGIKFKFYYGDKDWMDIVAIKNTMDNEFEPKHRFVPTIVRDCGHQMQFDNSEELVKHIQLGFYEFEEINVNQSNYLSQATWFNQINIATEYDNKDDLAATRDRQRLKSNSEWNLQKNSTFIKRTTSFITNNDEYETEYDFESNFDSIPDEFDEPWFDVDKKTVELEQITTKVRELIPSQTNFVNYDDSQSLSEQTTVLSANESVYNFFEKTWEVEKTTELSTDESVYNFFDKKWEEAISRDLKEQISNLVKN